MYIYPQKIFSYLPIPVPLIYQQKEIAEHITDSHHTTSPKTQRQDKQAFEKSE